jgi:signal peptidase II
MKNFFTKGRIAVLVIISTLIIDQVIKILVKTHMYLHDCIFPINSWYNIYFTENNGMAFGMELFGKLFLTTFRIAAVAVIGWYLVKMVKAGAKTGFIVCVSLVFTGALGNILDSMFYGVIFSESTPYQLATLFPSGGGYAPFLYGKVVDMFYFPIINTYWPTWMPFVGGQHFIFFSPIFNFADSCISCGIIALIIFYGKYFNSSFRQLKKH